MDDFLQKRKHDSQGRAKTPRELPKGENWVPNKHTFAALETVGFGACAFSTPF